MKDSEIDADTFKEEERLFVFLASELANSISFFKLLGIFPNSSRVVYACTDKDCKKARILLTFLEPEDEFTPEFINEYKEFLDRTLEPVIYCDCGRIMLPIQYDFIYGENDKDLINQVFGIHVKTEPRSFVAITVVKNFYFEESVVHGSYIVLGLDGKVIKEKVIMKTINERLYNEKIRALLSFLDWASPFLSIKMT